MIKCTYFSKLLKLGLFTLLIGFFGFGVNCSVNAFECDSYSTYGFSCWDLELGESVSWSGYVSPVIDENFNFLSNTFDYINSQGVYRVSYFRKSDGLHYNYVRSQYGGSSSSNGKISGFFVCSTRPAGNIKLSNYSNCEYYFNFVDLGGFLDDVDLWSYSVGSVSSTNNPIVCLYSSNYTQYVCLDWYSYYQVEENSALSSSDVSSIATLNPFVSNYGYGNNQVIGGESIDGFNYVGTDEENLVSYFEDNSYYKFDDNVCYVGTDDFSLYYSLDDNPIFYKGRGDNIFDLYAFLFGNTYTTKQVGMFIDAWSTNYGIWFKGNNRDENGDVDWLAGYSASSGYYQIFGTGLYNPFYGERLAVYFMGMNTNSYMKLSSTLGEQIATYCYYKLTGDINTGYNITDNSDSSFRDNAGQFSQNLRRFKTYFSGSDSIQSQSRDGTPLQYLTGDDDLDFSTFFSKSFNKFKDSFSINPTDFGGGFLPTWIILFLMALVVFRFISH